MGLRLLALFVGFGIALLSPTVGAGAEAIRVADLKHGTFAWELDIIRAHGLDKAAGLTIEVEDFASPQAAQIALNAGSTDVIVSDWLWVARERGLGTKLVFYPYSSALGALMAPRDSPVHGLADLKGKKLAVAGGPLDKSWLLVQAAAKLDGIDLKAEATVVYGAPALLSQKTLQGEMDANLNFWNFCAALEAKGLRRVAGVEDFLHQLGVKGRPALLGYVVREDWEHEHRDTLRRFIDVTRRAKELLASSDAEWTRIAPLVGVSDEAALSIYRNRYREGIPRRPIAEEEEDAKTLFRVLARVGGPALVGDATELAPGTFGSLAP